MDRQQELMNEVYAKWQKLSKENKKITKNEVLKLFPEKYSVAVKLGNLNYQVENGGFSQWCFNGYLDEDIRDLEDYIDTAKKNNITNIDILEKSLLPIIEVYENHFRNCTLVGCNECEGTGWYEDEEGNEEECCECGGTGAVEIDFKDYMADYYDFNDEECDFFSLDQEDRFKLFEDIIDLYE